MNLDRTLSLCFCMIMIIYGYTAFFVMDELLPPFAKHSAIWPSTFPKVISVLGVLVGAGLVFHSLRKAVNETPSLSSHNYHWKGGGLFIAFMLAYAILLRPMGFIPSSIAFLVAGGLLLGEKRHVLLVVIASVFSIGIWYLVQEVLGIFLRPWPSFL